MINKAGKLVTANADSLASAMADFAGAFDDKLTTNIVDGGGENSWPISGYTYAILRTQTMTDCLKAEKLLGFFKWALTDEAAAKRAADLGYSVLSVEVQKLVLDKMATITCSGNPVMP
jgi:phosphate transport system substrate-binding protein